jgi:hypothetical protein
MILKEKPRIIRKTSHPGQDKAAECDAWASSGDNSAEDADFDDHALCAKGPYVHAEFHQNAVSANDSDMHTECGPAPTPSQWSFGQLF